MENLICNIIKRMFFRMKTIALLVKNEFNFEQSTSNKEHVTLLIVYTSPVYISRKSLFALTMKQIFLWLSLFGKEIVIFY